jgi:Tol biopolymer transport system component/pimeloyl-ACP methyl ester carboxylesterase
MPQRRLVLAGLAVALVVGGSYLVVGRSRTPAGRGTPATAADDRDRIAYADGGHIWVVDANGTGRTQITTGPQEDAFPRWSPDGRRIAFIRQLRPKRDPTDEVPTAVVVADVDGSHQRIVSPPPLGGDFPAWSPDGTRIAFSTRRGLAVVGADGGAPTRLPVIGSCPTWSPDGTRIAFCGVGVGRPDNSTIMVVGADGSGLRTVLPGTARNYPGGWSPDGRRIAFSSDRDGDLDLFTVGADGAGMARVLRASGGQSIDAWLPDGRIVYEDTPDGAERSEVRTIRPDGSHLVRYPQLPAPDPIDWLPPLRARARPSVVSPGTSGPAAPGLLVDVGGRRLFLDCQGTAGPTVVLDAGLGVTSDTWAAVQHDARRFARVCRYDRAGLGASDAGPPPRTSAAMVRDLHSLLHAAQVRGPYIMVGASLGGLNAQLFASLYPQEVAGLVLVDALHPDLDRRIERILSPAQVRRRRADLAHNPEGVTFADLLASDAQVRAARVPTDLPLVALRHGLPFQAAAGFPSAAVERLWAELQRDLVARSRRGFLVVAHHSHHRIAESEPGLVVAAIHTVMAAG